MQRTLSAFIILTLVVMVFAPAAGQMADETFIVSGEMVNDLNTLSEKWVSLCEAMPESSLDWRPGDGVRSVRELYTHIADANRMFLSIAGIKLPKGPEVPKDKVKRENRFETKAEILANLKSAFALAKEHIAKISDKTMEAEVNMFGNKVTTRAAMMANLGHTHEHLGQAIAYARVNGIVPPWSRGN